MDKNCEITIRRIGNGWEVIPRVSPALGNAVMLEDVFAFNKFQYDQEGVSSDLTLVGWLAQHFEQ